MDNPTTGQESFNKFWKIYPSLPPRIKKAIVSAETAKIIQGLIEKYGLDDQPSSKLANLVGDTLLGLIKKENLSQKLQEAYSLPSELAVELSNELEDLIFRPLQLPKKPKKRNLLHSGPEPLRDIYGDPIL